MVALLYKEKAFIVFIRNEPPGFELLSLKGRSCLYGFILDHTSIQVPTPIKKASTQNIGLQIESMSFIKIKSRTRKSFNV